MSAEKWMILADALVMGPLLVYNARTVKSPYFRIGLAAAGVATALYALHRLRQPEPEQAPGVAGLQYAPSRAYYRLRV